MSDFIAFKEAINKQLNSMTEKQMFRTTVTKDELWDTYLDSFPPGTNEIYRERREFDCQCCKQFIRAGGDAVIIENGELVSIWDVKVPEPFQIVADTLSKLVKGYPIKNKFLYYENNMGTDHNFQELENSGVKRWDHFHFKLPDKYVNDSGTIDSIKGNTLINKEVFKRGLEEITIESMETVLELIDQNSLYRGAEHRDKVSVFMPYVVEYDKLDSEKEKDFYCWEKSIVLGNLSLMKNTVIGTLLIDLSKGKSLDYAVNAFGTKMDPTNFKRVTSIATGSMIRNAQKRFEALGLTGSEQRRYAAVDDISINNVLFANKDVKKSMSAFDELIKEAPSGKLSKVEEVSSEVFINDILPSINKIEVLFENNQENNLFSLIAPQFKESKFLFKWDNNYSWSYNGEVADSMKERVKKAGGNVEGVLRYSIQWNDGDNNPNDFDARCIEPNGNEIYYRNKTIVHPSSGMLDVDVQDPGNEVAVENIIYTNIYQMPIGKYHFLVHNYSHNGGMTGFTAEIEFNGELFSYVYDKGLKNNEKVMVADVELTKGKKFKIIKSLPSNSKLITKNIWGINTNNYHEVSMIMRSPNFWDGQKTGNSHLFFVINGCNNDKETLGFYNEFLRNDLMEYRKVFEVLAAKMKVKHTDNQLSGLGFSSTQRNSLICKVSGNFTRTLKIVF